MAEDLIPALFPATGGLSSEAGSENHASVGLDIVFIFKILIMFSSGRMIFICIEFDF